MEIKKSEFTWKPNYIKIPCTILKPNKENMEIFNQELWVVKFNEGFTELERSPSGGLTSRVHFPSYSYTYGNTGAELLVLDLDGFYRLQFRAEPEKVSEERTLSGRNAFQKFVEILEYYNINIDDYAVEDGEYYKAQIEKPMISLYDESLKDKVLGSVHHIDFHNSYPGGLKRTHPEFSEVIDDLYRMRKDNPIYKAILNYSIGFMQSKWCNYRYAKLSRDAINDNNARIRQVSDALKNSGRSIIAYNTDGIWYKGDVFHGELEGKNCGEWENDHINCTIRFKSAGSYEYIENNHYYPVVRGYTNLDKIRPRSEWKWGDIYKAVVSEFYFTDDGIYEGEEWETYLKN